MPAILICVLLLKAKNYAKKGSGEVGSMVVQSAKMLGGLALGVAGGGAALAGRATIGAVAKSVQNDSARKNDFTFKDTRAAAAKLKGWGVLNPLNYAKLAGTATVGVGKFATSAVATGIHAIPAGKDAAGVPISLGKRAQEADKGFREKTHATHILDEKMQSEFGHLYGKDAKYKNLTEPEQKIVKQEIDKDEMAKKEYGKRFKDLEAPEAKMIKDRYDSGERPIADQDGKVVRIDNPASMAADEKIKSNYFADISKVNASVGEFVQALRKGTYDIRNLPDVKTVSKGLPKFSVGLLAAVAGGVRLGLKHGTGIDTGIAKGDFLKDLRNTVEGALKNIKVNVSGGHGGGDDHPREVKSVGH